MTEEQDIRWKQRFSNFEKAIRKFNHTLQVSQENPRNELYQMALIQTFEFTFELGWKCVKDYLYHEGIPTSFPREAIKQGFQTHIIEDGQVWINMLKDRNLMSHTYDEEKANLATERITGEYGDALRQVHNFFKHKMDES